MKKKLLVIWMLSILFNYDAFSSHAAGMDIIYKFVGTPASPGGITGTGRQVTITVITDRFGDEASWNITDASGNVYAAGGPYTDNCNITNRTHISTVCLPTNTQLTFNWHDSYGDGWSSNLFSCIGGAIQGTYSVQQGTATLTSGSPSAGYGGSSTFSVNNSGTPTCTWTTLPSTEILKYEITLAFYYDCQNASPSAPLDFDLRWNDWSSSTNNNYNTITLSSTGSPTNVTPVCQNIPDPCNAGLAYAYEKYTYTGIIIFPNRDSWKIWNEPLSARNTTTYGPGNNTDDLCVVANIDNTTHLSSSPVFSSDPVSFLCTGGDCFYNGAIDPDLDDLSYSLTPPKTNQGAGNNMNYQNGTYLQPFPGSTTTCDPITGDLCITTNLQGTSVAAIKVSESRNGTNIGFVTRDVQIWSMTCSGTSSPTSSVTAGANTTFNSTSNSFSFCPDGSTNLTFGITAGSTVNL